MRQSNRGAVLGVLLLAVLTLLLLVGIRVGVALAASPAEGETWGEYQAPRLTALAPAPTPSPTPMVTPTPVPTPTIAPAPCTNNQDCFFQGYREADGQYPEAQIAAMIFCESSWRIDPGGYHLGLAQFEVGTWATVSRITGYTDWRDAYSQGVNTATWASMISPGTSAGWPVCFR